MKYLTKNNISLNYPKSKEPRNKKFMINLNPKNKGKPEEKNTN